MSFQKAMVPLPALVLLASACDSTGPEDRGLEVSLTAEAATPYFELTENGGRDIKCSVRFTARATGAANAAAAWAAGELRWYAGVDRVNPMQVEPLSTAAVRDFWNREGLQSGENATSTWEFWASVPFVIELELRYDVEGESRRSATARAECGLTSQVDAPEAPSVSDLGIQAPTPFEPGDTFTVSYHAQAAGRLWQTRIVISSAYDSVVVLPDSLSTQSRHSVELSVPFGVSPGTVLDVSVEAIDAFGQTSAQKTVRSDPLQDVTPPTLSLVSTTGTFDPYNPWRLVGQWAAGDTLRLMFSAWDNHALDHLNIDVGSDRRSVPLDGFEVISETGIEVRPDWIDFTSLAVHVTDEQGLAGQRHASHADSIRFFPSNARPVVGGSAGGTFSDAVWDDELERLYVAAGEAFQVIVFSTSTMSAERRIALPGAPAAIDLTEGRDSLVVTLPNRGSIAIVDLATDEITELSLAGAGLVQPRHMRMLGNGQAMVETHDAQGILQLALVDLADGAATSTRSIDGLHARLARNPERSVVAAQTDDGCVYVYSAVHGSFESCIPTDGGFGPLSITSSGTHVLAGCKLVDVAARAVRDGTWGLSLACLAPSIISDDGQTLYFMQRQGVTLVRASDGAAIERIPLAGGGQLLLLSRDGSRLLALSNDYEAAPESVRFVHVLLH